MLEHFIQQEIRYLKKELQQNNGKTERSHDLVRTHKAELGVRLGETV